MIKFERGLAPNCLTFKKNKSALTNAERWGKKWGNERKKKGSNAKWQWHEFEERRVNEIIIEQLRLLSNSHCAFCDKYAPDNDSDSIEHFHPKTLFPLKAYEWDNLFLSCGGCQKRPKGWKDYEDKRSLILNPSDEDYSFNRYFIFNAKNGEIEINEWNDSNTDSERAEITILYFKLNEFDRANARLKSFKTYYDSKSSNKIKPAYKVSVNELPYRFIYL